MHRTLAYGICPMNHTLPYGIGVDMNIVAAFFLGLLALAHSLLGEMDLLRPLFKADWELETVPRWAAELIFRFAWHLTSIAWVAFGAILLGVDPFIVISVQSFVCAVIIFFSLRGHLAWPLFLAVGVAALSASGFLSASVLKIAMDLSALGLGLVAILHLYWAAGGRFLADEAMPELRGEKSLDQDGKSWQFELWSFNPSATLTVGIALILGGMATVVFFQANSPNSFSFYGTIVIAAIMTLRSIGDFKYVGFTKTFRASTFAKYDDKLFTPFVAFIALSTGFGIALA